jgi:glycosyltransferase involved in cell wall biosynthesis
MNPRVRYYGPFAQHSGYAQAGHDYLMAMHRAGIELDIRPVIDCDTDNLDPRYAELLPLAYAQTELNWPTHVIIHTVPVYAHLILADAGVIPDGIKKIAMTTWETDKLPVQATESLRAFDEVWVPCVWNRDTARESDLNAYAIPHCFDSNWWHADGLPAPPPNRPYTFYTILTWCERKNPIGLLKAYLTGFTAEDNVLLKILTPSHNHGDLDTLIQSLNLPPEDLPPIVFVGQIPNRLTEHELKLLHWHSDCYVTAARGEGWGLGAFEAALLGRLVIAPNYSGLVDFLGDYTQAYSYGYQLTPAIVAPLASDNVIKVGGLEIRPVQHNTHVGIAADQNWAEPNLVQLRSNMQAAVHHHRRGSITYAATLRKRYDYPAVGKLIRDRLEH